MMESLHEEVCQHLHTIEKSIIAIDDSVKTTIQKQIIEMKDWLNIERNEYEVLLPNILLFYSSHPSFYCTDFCVNFLTGCASTSYKWECSCT
jgi:hypothetical protein